VKIHFILKRFGGILTVQARHRLPSTSCGVSNSVLRLFNSIIVLIVQNKSECCTQSDKGMQRKRSLACEKATKLELMPNYLKLLLAIFSCRIANLEKRITAN
jgi:hypothetical protein